MTPTTFLEQPKVAKVKKPPRPKSPIIRPKKSISMTPSVFMQAVKNA